MLRTMPRGRPRRRGRALRFALVLLVMPFLIGCGGSPFDQFEDGFEVTAVGVVHVPVTTSGDFVPRKLVATLSGPVVTSQLQAVVAGRLPGAIALVYPDDPTQASIQTPVGTSMSAAARILVEDPLIATVAPEFPPTQSVGNTLHRTDTLGFVDQEAQMAFVISDVRGLLEGVSHRQVVAIRGRLPKGVSDVKPTSTIKVETLEVKFEYQLQLVGVFRLLGTGSACRVLSMDSGDWVELTGDVAEELANSGGANGARLRVTGVDQGLSAETCSGGRRIRLVSYLRL